MYALAERDRLWTVSEQRVRDFVGLFKGSARVEWSCAGDGGIIGS